MRISILMFLFSALATFTFYGCNSEKSQTESSGAKEPTAKIISELPASVISPDAPLYFRFVNAVVTDTSEVPVKDALQITPNLKVRLSWSDARTLKATPLEEAARGMEYKASLKPSVLLPNRFKDIAPIKFTFRTLSQEVTGYEGRFTAANEGKAGFVSYRGRISLLLKADLNAVKNAFTIKEGRNSLPLNWHMERGGRSFSFDTERLRRQKTDRHFLVQVDAAALQLERDFKYDLVLPAIASFKAVNVIVAGGNEANPQIKITFSDILATDQDIRGLISIEPAVPIKIKKSASTVTLSGPFIHGQDYTINIHPGIRDKWGGQTTKLSKEKLTFENIQPQIRFARGGIILPSDKEQKIAFTTVNVAKVHLNIMRVFESNIGQFLQMERLDGNSLRRNEFSYQMERVGITVADTDLVISSTSNKWLQSEVDIANLIDGHARGFLLLHLSFNKKDMIYKIPKEDNSYRDYRRKRRNRFGSVGSYWYMYNMANVYKPVIVSDIGLTLKTGANDTRVYATDLISGKPLPKTHIILRTLQNQMIAELETDSEGMARFYDIDEKIFYVEGLRNGQRSIIKTNDMAWNLSSFDISGTVRLKNTYKGFIYNDRGVYRPGDTIHVSALFRSDEKPMPDGLPVTLKVKNPRGQLVYEKINTSGNDGFYSFTFSSAPTDPTGLYIGKFSAGATSFDHRFRIETIAPERLKVKVSSNPHIIDGKTKKAALHVDAKYLFGAPAGGLPINIRVSVNSVLTRFKRYKDFIFNSTNSDFHSIDEQVSSGVTDKNGAFDTSWRKPSLSNAPGMLRALFNVSVREKGGRPVKRQLAVPFHVHPRYVGYRPAELQWNYAQLNSTLKIPAVMVNTDGEALVGKNIHYRIYHNESNWWWEYNSRDRFRMRFKEATNSIQLDEGNLISAARPVNLQFTPVESGEYMIEFSDPAKGGHTVNYFFSAGFYGGGNRAKDAGDLALHNDKHIYRPGDEAVISFPMPAEAIALVTVEKGGHIVSNHWHYPSGKSRTEKVRIPVTEEMQPTAYVSVSVIQPHQATLSDRPLRSYGVVPLNIHNPDARQKIMLKMPKELKPGQSFDVHLQTGDKQPTQYTVALVDEGLLQLTRFKSPDPLAFFFRKEKLSIRSYDLYGKVLGANRGDIFKTFSIGGDMDLAMLNERKTGNTDKNSAIRRFKPVAFFEGPLQSDAHGALTVHFSIPDYIGELRLMVVSASKNRYGSLEKHVPVKADLMVLPTAPRVLGPGDMVRLPVTVFANTMPAGPVGVTIKTKGPIKIIGPAKRHLTFTKTGERDINFKVQALQAIGPAQIRIEASDGRSGAHYKADLPIRASAQQEHISIRKETAPGNSVRLKVPPRGIKGSSKALLTLRLTPDMNLGPRLFELIRYPYGCIEQTISSALPQLFIRNFIAPSQLADKDIADNINNALRRLRKFTLRSGAFGYWPGANDFSAWGTNYAGHFMIEARKHGYYVPDDLFDGWQRFEQSRALLTTEDMTTRLYRLYLLALSGNPAIGPMNLIKEGALDQLNNTQRWLLAAAYKLSGNEDEAKRISSEAGITVADKGYDEHTFGTAQRDKGLILQQAVLFKQWPKADRLTDELIVLMRSDNWLSTQEKAFILMGLAQYQSAMIDNTNMEQKLNGSIRFADGQTKSFDTNQNFFSINVDAKMDQDIRIDFSDKCTSKRLFATLDWSGIPLIGKQKNMARNLSLNVLWMDENGRAINPVRTKQGQTIWGLFQVGLDARRGRLKNLALTQIIPSGWEIENNLSQYTALPSWATRLKVANATYQDIRDDRAQWFFDLYGKQTRNFLLKINVVSQGHFYLPGAMTEAMYDHSYRATKAGAWIDVVPAGVRP